MLGDLTKRDRSPGCGFRQLCQLLFGRGLCTLTCRGLSRGTNGYAGNASKRAVSKVDVGRVRAVVRQLGSRDCHPYPTREVCVPGGGKGRHPLNVPTFGSGLMRRVIEVVLRSVCRNRFRSYSRKFEPHHNYRATVTSLRGKNAKAH